MVEMAIKRSLMVRPASVRGGGRIRLHAASATTWRSLVGVAHVDEASQSGHTEVIEELLTDETRTAIRRLAALHGARDVRVFGSIARGDADPDSDLDLLVDFEPGRSLLDQVALRLDLEELLDRRVDVVTEAGLSRLLRRRIMGEARPL